MVKENERLMILDLLEKGKVTSEEADKLLLALQPSESATVSEPEVVNHEAGEKEERAHWIRIRVTDLSSGKRKLSMTLPLFFIRWGIKFSNRYVDSDKERSGLAIGEEFFRRPVKGKVVDVADPDDDEHVEISFL